MTLGPSRYLIGTVTQIKRRLIPGVVDRYGNDVYSTTTVTLGPPLTPGAVDQGVLLEPRLTFGTEKTDAQQHVGAGLDLFCADPDADIQPTDRFVVDGLSYEVTGPTNRYRGSYLNNNFCHVNLGRITG